MGEVEDEEEKEEIEIKTDDPEEEEKEEEAEVREPAETCFDYMEALDIGKKDCTWWYLFHHIRNIYVEKDHLEENQSCEGGLTNDLTAVAEPNAAADPEPHGYGYR